jgi:hypothetical protein
MTVRRKPTTSGNHSYITSFGRDDATARTLNMLHASALATGWRSALSALVEAHKHADRVQTRFDDAEGPEVGPEPTDDEREAFHLDDTELAQRLVRDRGIVRYRTPPNTHLVFPFLPNQ